MKIIAINAEVEIKICQRKCVPNEKLGQTVRSIVRRYAARRAKPSIKSVVYPSDPNFLKVRIVRIAPNRVTRAKLRIIGEIVLPNGKK